jgi:hypothetical protein
MSKAAGLPMGNLMAIVLLVLQEPTARVVKLALMRVGAEGNNLT